jgi:hypothetical protein
MPYDPGLVERVDAALPRLGARGVRQKHVFGGRGFLLGKSTFVIVWGEGLLVKTPAAEYAAAGAEPGVTAFAPDGGRPMGRGSSCPPSGSPTTRSSPTGWRAACARSPEPARRRAGPWRRTPWCVHAVLPGAVLPGAVLPR